MSLKCFDNVLGEFHRPPVFHYVAQGLANSSLNPMFYNSAAMPLRFLAALAVTAVSPVFAACDFLVYMGACIVFRLEGRGDWALQNLRDCGFLCLRFIPEAMSFPFVFAYAPRFYEHLT